MCEASTVMWVSIRYDIVRLIFFILLTHFIYYFALLLLSLQPKRKCNYKDLSRVVQRNRYDVLSRCAGYSRKTGTY